MYHQTRRGTADQRRQAREPGAPTPQSSARVAQPMWGSAPALNLAPMERSLGADFSGVKIHPDSPQAADVGALAYTQGEEVHFAPGQFRPESSKGRQLLGHELTHVVQQRQGRVQPSTQVNGLPVNDDPALEAEADAKGAQAAQMAAAPELEEEDETKKPA